jgi:two-component system OmpR family response regulator
LRILLVEDNDRLASGIAEVLKGGGYVIDRVADGESALAAVAANSFDLTILDLSLPELDGLQVLRRMRGRGDATPVLVLTARDGLEDRVSGLDLGADDYMTKPFEVRELEARIRVLLRRRAGQHSSMLRFGALELDLSSHRATAGEAPLDIPRRELSILSTLMLANGRVTSKQSLVDTLSGFDEEVSDNAVEQYVSRLRRRLQTTGVTIRVARGIGYFLEKAAP